MPSSLLISSACGGRAVGREGAELDDFRLQWEAEIIEKNRLEEARKFLKPLPAGRYLRRKAAAAPASTIRRPPPKPARGRSIPQRNTAASLMSLPIETRQLIFSMAIYVPLAMEPTSGPYESHKSPETLQALCGINRQIRREMYDVICFRKWGARGCQGGVRPYATHHEALRNRAKRLRLEDERGRGLGCVPTSVVFPDWVSMELVNAIRGHADGMYWKAERIWKPFTAEDENDLLTSYIIQLTSEH